MLNRTRIVIAALLGGGAVGAFAAAILSLSVWLHSAPFAPVDPYVVAYNNHGQFQYLTPAQDLLTNLLLSPTIVILCLVAVVVHPQSRLPWRTASPTPEARWNRIGSILSLASALTTGLVVALYGPQLAERIMAAAG